jgi:hypothetical protein
MLEHFYFSFSLSLVVVVGGGGGGGGGVWRMFKFSAYLIVIRQRESKYRAHNELDETGNRTEISSRESSENRAQKIGASSFKLTLFCTKNFEARMRTFSGCARTVCPTAVSVPFERTEVVIA